MEFSHELALALVSSDEEFPVDFDDAWKWIGYSRKDTAKEFLVANFEKDVDFSAEFRKTPNGGRPSEHIALTIDCFKSLGMMAGTEKGKEIRRYFLNCERELKQQRRIESQPTPELPTTPEPVPVRLEEPEVDPFKILQQIKPGLFIKWQAHLFTTNDRVADLYGVDYSAIRRILQSAFRPKLDEAGLVLRQVKSKALRKKLEVKPSTSQLVLWTPLAVVRLADYLKESPVSTQIKALTAGSAPTLPALPPEPTPIAATPVTVQPQPLPAPIQRDPLEDMERAVRIGKELGGFDERQRILLRDRLMNLLVPGQAALPTGDSQETRLEMPISDRAHQLGYAPTYSQLLTIGQKAAQAYRAQHGSEPQKREQWVHGATRMVNVYTPADVEILDAAIKSVMEG